MNIQNTVNNREGFLYAQNQQSDIFNRLNKATYKKSVGHYTKSVVQNMSNINSGIIKEVRTKESIKNNTLIPFVQYKKQLLTSPKLGSAKNNHSSLRRTVSYLDKLLAQCYSEHQGNFSLMMRLPDNIGLAGLAQSGEYLSKQSQPLGVMPKRLSSSRPRVFSQFPKEIPASEATISNCAFNSGDNLIWKVGDSPLPFFVISLFSIDMYVRNLIVYKLLCTYFIIMYSQEKTPSYGATNTNQGLTTMLIEVTVMALYKSTQTHPKFTDTYWIIPLDSNIPYGKVSLTRRESRLFRVLFKDDRLVWSGRKPITPQSIIECSACHAQEVAYA